MRAVLQRVSAGSVKLSGGENRPVGKGLVVLLGVGPSDGAAERDWMIEKILNLRLFPKSWGPPPAAEGKSEFDLSVSDVGGEILLVSQFTLFGDVKKGRRPDFTDAAPPDRARAAYDDFAAALKSRFPRVRTGEFGDMMTVDIRNEGPVTILLDTDRR